MPLAQLDKYQGKISHATRIRRSCGRIHEPARACSHYARSGRKDGDGAHHQANSIETEKVHRYIKRSGRRCNAGSASDHTNACMERSMADGKITRAGTSRKKNVTFYKDSIVKKSIPEPNTGCWLWIGAILNSGYGKVQCLGKLIPAHRASYLLFRGEIPDGMYVCHRCHLKLCVNPDHLYVASNSQNIIDSINVRGSWATIGEKN